jgi:hypothetical protein
MENFEFLKASRFWAMVIGAVALYLQNKGVIGEAELTFIVTIISGFIGIRTVDRFGEKIGGE